VVCTSKQHAKFIEKYLNKNRHTSANKNGAGFKISISALKASLININAENFNILGQAIVNT